MKARDLKPGDILLCPPVPFRITEPLTCLGHIIIAITKGKVSHAAVYCGVIDGVHIVAHADLPGIATINLTDFLASEHKCYVFRHSAFTGTEEIANIAIDYTKASNPYPKINLGVLGMLLLYNRFSLNVLRDKKFYCFVVWLSLKIMKEIQNVKHPGKTPMTCSQFASQCYTDAGKELDIQFQKMYIQAGSFKLQKGISDSASLISFASNSTPRARMLAKSTPIDVKSIIGNECDIISDFADLLESEGKDGVLLTRSSTKNSTNTSDIQKVAEMLRSALTEYMLDIVNAFSSVGQKGHSTERNYFVTPDDLYFNTKNLIEVGELSDAS